MAVSVCPAPALRSLYASADKRPTGSCCSMNAVASLSVGAPRPLAVVWTFIMLSLRECFTRLQADGTKRVELQPAATRAWLFLVTFVLPRRKTAASHHDAQIESVLVGAETEGAAERVAPSEA